MKILVVGDVHFSQYSSIIRSRGEKFSTRLENLIKSINWAEGLADSTGCEQIVYLGDFLDRPELNAEEISALNEINWSRLPHVFLVGNHEVGRKDLLYNAANLFSLRYFEVVDRYYKIGYAAKKLQLIFLPYIFEDNRLSLKEHILDSKNDYPDYKTIIFSHNDIKGFQMGNFISETGFSIDEIESNCDLYLNGHLHNGGKVTDKIINVGNLTGQNFSEDATRYEHMVLVLDTDSLSCEVYENPYAFNFYKLDFTNINPNEDIVIDIINNIKQNMVCTIKCCDEYLNEYKEIVKNIPSIVESRFVVQYKTNTEMDKEDVVSLNHLDKFREYVVSKLGDNDIVNKELQEVLK